MILRNGNPNVTGINLSQFRQGADFQVYMDDMGMMYTFDPNITQTVVSDMEYSEYIEYLDSLGDAELAYEVNGSVNIVTAKMSGLSVISFTSGEHKDKMYMFVPHESDIKLNLLVYGVLEHNLIDNYGIEVITNNIEMLCIKAMLPEEGFEAFYRKSNHLL